MRLVFSYARRYAGVLAVTISADMLLVGIQLLIPLVIRALLAPFNTGDLTQDTLSLITRLTFLVLIAYLARAALKFLSVYMSHVAGWSVVADVRKFIYDHVQRLGLRFYQDQQTGQLMSRVINDTDHFEDLISHAIPDVLVSLFSIIGVSTIMFNLNWQLALLSLIPVPFVIIGMRLYARIVRPAFRERQKELGTLNAILADNLSGIREIQAFTREEEESHRFQAQIDRYRRFSLQAIKLMSVFQPAIEFASSLGLLIIVYFGGRMAFNQTLALPDLVAFFLYLDILYQPVRTLSTSWEQFQRALASADRVADLLMEQPEPRDQPGAIPLVTRAAGHIAFQDVSFAYNADIPVLEHIELDIPTQHVVALVGPSGVGKSTLVSLIPRFYDPHAGRVTLDGQDIKGLSIESVRQQISIVLQDVFLFHGTVRENILFGRPKASDAEVIKAAQIANAAGFIEALPDGYQTIIGERGVKLSGGQKQRISIARAVLKDAPILILDEATSAVDTETELLIQQALERLMLGRTTIIIAHRLSTVRSADMIVVLEGHGIAEKGRHEELLARRGLYQKLYNIQAQLDGLTSQSDAQTMAGEGPLTSA
ncbi:MAG: ABC transporter ATP-binding protein/permease [Dehalococcoidia bacterium]|nr:ABC transporter ATP-binding protein/permease [Dehalococcoidia bacterium]